MRESPRSRASAQETTVTAAADHPEPAPSQTASDASESSGQKRPRLTDLPWHEWVERMTSQPGRNLADRCHLELIDGRPCLVVAPEFEEIASARARESLLAQLSRMADTNGLNIVIGQGQAANPSVRSPSTAPAAITPAERRQQEENSLHEQRRASITHHPVVQLLQAQAGAQVVEESIRPRDKAAHSAADPVPTEQ